MQLESFHWCSYHGLRGGGGGGGETLMHNALPCYPPSRIQRSLELFVKYIVDFWAC